MKNKFRLWLNIATICLCVCAIAIGVYAATSATLTVSGQIGFEAHGVDMTITGQLSGYVLSTEQDTATATRTRTLNTVTLGGEQKIEKGIMSFADSAGIQSGTDVYFTDLVMDDEGTVPEIVLSLTLTNTSLFQVQAEIDVTILSTSEITATSDKSSILLDAVGESNSTVTLEITFTLVNSENSITTALDLSEVTTPIIEFTKFSVRSLLDGDSTTGYYFEMGEYNGTALKWYPFAKLDSNGNVVAKLNDGSLSYKQELSSGTYYFISEKILNATTVSFNANGYSGKIDDHYGLDYNGSTIQKYITGNMLAEYSISDDIIYNEISKRILPGEGYVIYDLDDYDITDSTLHKTKDTLDQSLWLLNNIEFSYLEESKHTVASKYGYTLNDSSYEENWRLRSPGTVFSRSEISSTGFANGFDGTCGYEDITMAYGIRPAFQIDIA